MTEISQKQFEELRAQGLVDIGEEPTAAPSMGTIKLESADGKIEEVKADDPSIRSYDSEDDQEEGGLMQSLRDFGDSLRIPIVSPIMERAGAALSAGIEQGAEALGFEGAYPGQQTFGEAYEEARATTKALEQIREERSPIATTAGEIAGSLALPLPPALQAAKGLAGFAGRAGAEAAIVGADVVAQGKALEAAGEGAATTAALQGAIESVPVVGRAIGKGLAKGMGVTQQQVAKNLASSVGLKTTTDAVSTAQKLVKAEEELGKKIAKGNNEEISKNANDYRNLVGKKIETKLEAESKLADDISNFLRTGQKPTTAEAKKLVSVADPGTAEGSRILNEFNDAFFGNKDRIVRKIRDSIKKYDDIADEKTIGELEKFAKKFEAKSDELTSLKGMHSRRVGLDKSIYSRGRQLKNRDALVDIRNILNEEIMDKSTKLKDLSDRFDIGKKTEELAALNQKYAFAAELNRAAEKIGGKETKGILSALFRPASHLGLGGFVVGGPVGAALGLGVPVVRDLIKTPTVSRELLKGTPLKQLRDKLPTPDKTASQRIISDMLGEKDE